MNIFLDDVRVPPEGYYLVSNVDDCMALVIDNRGNVDTLSLDNDLGIPGLENEGREVLKELARYLHEEGIDMWPSHIVIHSANSVARQAMEATILHDGPGYRKVAPHRFDRIW